MNFYRKLLKDYEGKRLTRDCAGAYIFSDLRTVCMFIAYGDQNGAYNHAQKLFYNNLLKSNSFSFNLRDGESFSNICEYSFKPIFSGSNFMSLISDGEYAYSKQCHNITLAYLKYLGSNNDNICAVTSLINGLDNIGCFHSYILDCESNMVWDFANNIVMPKSKYYELMVDEEISAFNYSEYVLNISHYTDEDKDGLADLLFLGLIELENRSKKKINL